MITAIVGYTGFVGSNLCYSTKFDAYYNSKNIQDAFGTQPDLLIYSGVRAEMFLANNFPDKDLAIINNAIDNIRKIEPKRVVLISSIAVYNQTYDVDEDTSIDKEKSTAYGRNRRILEEWVELNCSNSLIVRLPGIFGINLKKNFVFDMINIIPSMLTKVKYEELSELSDDIRKSYTMLDNGFAKCIVKDAEREYLKTIFKRICFTSLNFTDSRGIYQYFDLSLLWSIIKKSLDRNIRILNVAVEPMTAGELYQYVEGKPFVNELNKPIAHFDFKTKHAELFDGQNGYIMPKEECLKRIKTFILSQSTK